jgi:hypothetical protein
MTATITYTNRLTLPAEVFGPVTFWHEACLSRAGHGRGGTEL